jgi:hypothetical protein
MFAFLTGVDPDSADRAAQFFEKDLKQSVCYVEGALDTGLNQRSAGPLP